MPKYEIMLILDPRADIAIANDIAKKVFGDGVKKSIKLKRTALAYKINNSNTATYLLMNIITDPKNIAEFNRRVNITKKIWRHLVINLDAEKAARGSGFNLNPAPWRPRGQFNKRNFDRKTTRSFSEKNPEINKAPEKKPEANKTTSKTSGAK